MLLYLQPLRICSFVYAVWDPRFAWDPRMLLHRAGMLTHANPVCQSSSARGRQGGSVAIQKDLQRMFAKKITFAATNFIGAGGGNKTSNRMWESNHQTAATQCLLLMFLVLPPRISACVAHLCCRRASRAVCAARAACVPSVYLCCLGWRCPEDRRPESRVWQPWRA